MSRKKVLVACPQGHRLGIKPRQVGREIRCRRIGCGTRFVAQPVADGVDEPAAAPMPVAATRPTVEGDTIELSDLRTLIGAPPAAREQGALEPAPPRARRRPWFALALAAVSVAFVFCVPVRRCGECGGRGEFAGRTVYEEWWVFRRPVGSTAPRRCATCSGSGRLTLYQLVFDRGGGSGGVGSR